MNINLLNKQSIAKSFSRSAATYDQAAQLQHEVAAQLLNLLSPYPIQPNLLIDLGSGTGRNTQQLQEKFPHTHCVALDIAQGMLSYAQQQYAIPNTLWLCADAEHLPLRDTCCDLIFSSLMLQWSSNLSQNFAELRRVLAANGLIALSSFGPLSLSEWRNCWLDLGLNSPVHSFASKDDLIQALQENGFDILVFTSRIYTRKYAQAIDLPIELKKIGASNAQNNVDKGLASRTRLQQVLQRYGQLRNGDGLISASYEIFYIVARKRDC